MAKFLTALRMVTALAVLGGLVYIVVRAVEKLAEMPAEVGVAVIAGVVALTTFVAERWVTRQTGREDRRRERLAPAYEKLLEAFWDLLAGKNPDIGAVFSEFSRTLVLWAPADVIRAFNKWRRSADEHTDSVDALLAFEELVRAIRKDLGQDHSIAALPNYELLRTFVNDLDDALAAAESGT